MLTRILEWLRLRATGPISIYEPKLLSRFDQVDSFVASYRHEPRSELVWQMLDFLGTDENVRDCVPGTVGFLSEFLAAHPDRLRELKRLASSKGPMLENVLHDGIRLSRFPDRALILKIESAHELNPNWRILFFHQNSGSLNDLYWGAFYASGNLSYIDRLVEHMAFVKELQDLMLYMAGETACWSLCCHSYSDRCVREHFETTRNQRSARLNALVEEVLTADPRILLKNVVEFFEPIE